MNTSLLTPATQLLTMVGDWSEVHWNDFKLTSDRARYQAKFYKIFPLKLDEDQRGLLTLGAPTASVVELRQIVAFEYRKGIGTAVMSRLCGLADKLDVTLFLNVLPTRMWDRLTGEVIPGPNEADLIRFYARFAFERRQAVANCWLSLAKRLGEAMPLVPMVRIPGPKESCLTDSNGEEASVELLCSPAGTSTEVLRA
jgi:hypothetical protein